MKHHDCNRTAFFWFVMTISAALFMPMPTYAQRCTGNIQVGCLHAGAVCSPVTVGRGASGHCTTSAGPPGERECNCAGMPVPPPSPPSIKDLDVVSTVWDSNHFPLNPKWGQQVRDNTLPNPVTSCPPDSTTTSDWTSSSQYPDCTSYPVTFNGASGFVCGHHTNFMPVTYDATVAWDGGPSFFPFGDEDYSFNLTRDDAALYSTAGHRVHAEFDVTETANNWDGTGTWWENFHHNGVDKGDDKARQMIDGHHVIVVGLLGLDEYSGIGHSQSSKGHTELHPIYAMFVLVNQNLTSRKGTWAFFVRNWGNEGYCGPDQENMSAQTIRIQIPHVPGTGPAGAIVGKTALVAENAWEGARNTDDLRGMNVAAQPNGGGMLLTFNLLAPGQQSWFMGDLTFQETALRPPVKSAEMQGTIRLEDGVPPEFQALLPQFNKLPASTQQQIRVEQQAVVPVKPGKRASIATATQSTQLGNTNSRQTIVTQENLINSKKDSAYEVIRSKQLQVLKKRFAK
jgi:hypothetical protein